MKNSDMVYFDEYGVILSYEYDRDQEGTASYYAAEDRKKQYLETLKNLIKECLYEISQGEIDFRKTENVKTESRKGTYYDDEYGVLLHSDGSEEGIKQAKREYIENLKKMIKQCLYNMRADDFKRYADAMKRLDELREKLN